MNFKNFGMDKLHKDMLGIIKQYPNSSQQLLMNMANFVLARTKEKTPVKEGDLRRSWQLSSMRKTSNFLEIDIFSDMTYAEFVEFGYQQIAGQFVPSLGARLTGKFIKGKFMLTLSMKELEGAMPELTKDMYDRLFKELK